MENVTVNIKDQIIAARSRIAELLLEIDDITLQVNPRIEAEYATKIGFLENELLKWQIAARRARRRYSLAQARANAGESFAEDEFEAQLDEELAEWDALLARSVEVFLQAAVGVTLPAGDDKIGFVPADCNEVLARLMDGGKALSGKLTGKEKLGTWNKLHMEVSLDD